MTPRRLPLWLLKDIPALAAMLATLWLLAITSMRAAIRKDRGHAPSPRTLQRIFSLFAATEAAHDWAIMRQAFRALGYPARTVPFPDYTPPTSLQDYDERFTAWQTRASHLDAAARQEAERLRRALHITRASAQAPTAIGVRHRPLSSLVAQRRGRWIAASSRRDGGGSRRTAFSTQARAPPAIPHLSSPPCGEGPCRASLP